MLSQYHYYNYVRFPTLTLRRWQQDEPVCMTHGWCADQTLTCLTHLSCSLSVLAVTTRASSTILASPVWTYATRTVMYVQHLPEKSTVTNAPTSNLEALSLSAIILYSCLVFTSIIMECHKLSHCVPLVVWHCSAGRTGNARKNCIFISNSRVHIMQSPSFCPHAEWPAHIFHDTHNLSSIIGQLFCKLVDGGYSLSLCCNFFFPSVTASAGIHGSLYLWSTIKISITTLGVENYHCNYCFYRNITEVVLHIMRNT